MPGPPQISYPFFPTGFFMVGFSGHPGTAYSIYRFFISIFVLGFCIILKWRYGVHTGHNPIFSVIYCVCFIYFHLRLVQSRSFLLHLYAYTSFSMQSRRFEAVFL